MRSGGLKRFLERWVIPPGWLEARRRRLLPAVQKFWRGSPVPAPAAEVAWFAAAGKQAQTLTRRDDSRPAALLDGPTDLPLPAGDGDAVQFAVAAEEWQPADILRIAAGDKSVAHVGLKPGHWLDIRLPLGAGAEALRVDASRPVHVSCPRSVRTSTSAVDGIRHVLVIVLDGMTPFLETADPSMLPGGQAAPNIERFFAGGFAASNGWATGEWTLPTTASFFTGLHTARHGVYHPTLPMALPSRPLLAEMLQGAGFHSLALSTANRLTPAFGSHRGFDRFLYHWPHPGYTELDYDPARWCDEVCGHLDAHRHDRSFVYAHFPDTHPAWDIPPLTRSFNLLRRGDSTGHELDLLKKSSQGAAQGPLLNMLRLHELDRLLGGIFDFIGRNLAEQTLVVLTADHGTPWQALRPSRPVDEPYLVDQRTRVTLRMRGPGVPAGNLDGLTSPTVDLMPTLLARLGLPCPADIDGRDLLDPGYRREWAISESLYDGKYELAVRDGSRVYIEKYPMADGPIRLTGPATYRKMFRAAENDYGRHLDDDPAALATVALRHRERVGLV